MQKLPVCSQARCADPRRPAQFKSYHRSKRVEDLKDTHRSLVGHLFQQGSPLEDLVEVRSRLYGRRLEESLKNAERILRGVGSLHRILQRLFELRQRPKNFIKIDD